MAVSEEDQALRDVVADMAASTQDPRPFVAQLLGRRGLDPDSDEARAAFARAAADPTPATLRSRGVA